MTNLVAQHASLHRVNHGSVLVLGRSISTLNFDFLVDEGLRMYKTDSCRERQRRGRLQLIFSCGDGVEMAPLMLFLLHQIPDGFFIQVCISCLSNWFYQPVTSHSLLCRVELNSFFATTQSSRLPFGFGLLQSSRLEL